MKIISRIPNESYLIKVNKDELANIMGEAYGSLLKRDVIDHLIVTEIDTNISDIYKKHSLITDLQSGDSYLDARKQLEKLLRALTPIESKILDLKK